MIDWRTLCFTFTLVADIRVVGFVRDAARSEIIIAKRSKYISILR